MNAIPIHIVTPPAESMTDSWELVTRTQAGDTTAFGILYSQYVNVVYRYLLSRTTDRDLAEDFTSETFCKALAQIGSVTYQNRDIGAWLITIARNILLDHIKSSRYRVEMTTADIHDSALTDPTPEETVIRSETAATVRRWLTALNPRYRKVLQLRFFDGLTVPETAAVIGKSVGATKQDQLRALRTLADNQGHQRQISQQCLAPGCPEIVNTGRLYCGDVCERAAASLITGLTPGERCHAPQCGKQLTVTQRQHQAKTCSSRCRQRLDYLRKAAVAA